MHFTYNIDKMSSENNEQEKETGSVAEKNDTNTDIEVRKKDFNKWIMEDDMKYMSKEIIESTDRKIKEDELPDTIVWNIFNLRSSYNAVFPVEKPNQRMFAMAYNWITVFRSYVIDVMSKHIRNEYIQIFNTSEFECLRGGNRAVVNWKEVTSLMKDETSKEVGFVMFDR